MLTAPLLAWTLVTGGCPSSGAWNCALGTSSVHQGTGLVGGASFGSGGAPGGGLDVKPMCQVTGGADHCWTPPDASTMPDEPGKPAKTPTADVVAMAWASFGLPSPVPHTNPAVRSWVSLPTYLWIDASGWKPRTARASVDGQTVTVTGTPQRVEWSLGEAMIVCRGPGTPYRRGDPPSDCSYTYRRPGRYAVTATAYYSVNWTCTGSCDSRSGSYGTFPASGSTHLNVQEIQTRTTG